MTARSEREKIRGRHGAETRSGHQVGLSDGPVPADASPFWLNGYSCAMAEAGHADSAMAALERIGLGYEAVREARAERFTSYADEVIHHDRPNPQLQAGYEVGYRNDPPAEGATVYWLNGYATGRVFGGHAKDTDTELVALGVDLDEVFPLMAARREAIEGWSNPPGATVPDPDPDVVCAGYDAGFVNEPPLPGASLWWRRGYVRGRYWGGHAATCSDADVAALE